MAKRKKRKRGVYDLPYLVRTPGVVGLDMAPPKTSSGAEQNQGGIAVEDKVIGVEAIKLAQMLADGRAEYVDCPYCGPDNGIVVTGDGKKLIGCPALTRFYESGKVDGRSCLSLHRVARGCPFQLEGRIWQDEEGQEASLQVA